jgi:poly(beta-D-mannuronate) lyase
VLFNPLFVGTGISVGCVKPLPPRNITVAYNLVQGNVNATAAAQVRSLANIVSGTAALSDGVTKADPQLVKMGDIFRIAAGIPAVDGADTSMFPWVMDDIDGRPRTGKADIGAEELSQVAGKFGLLAEKDVGPLAP